MSSISLMTGSLNGIRAISKSMLAQDPNDPKRTVEVTFAKGDWFTCHCPACGFDNGVRIAGPKTPPLPSKPDPCVMCGNPDMRWAAVARPPSC